MESDAEVVHKVYMVRKIGDRITCGVVVDDDEVYALINPHTGAATGFQPGARSAGAEQLAHAILHDLTKTDLVAYGLSIKSPWDLQIKVFKKEVILGHSKDFDLTDIEIKYWLQGFIKTTKNVKWEWRNPDGSGLPNRGRAGED